MELFILFTAITVVATFALLCRFISTKISSSSTTPLPPGTMGWPIVGESLNYFSCLVEGRTEKFVQDRINRYASSIFKTSFLSNPFIVMYGSEGNKFLFSNEGKLVRGWWPKMVHTIIPGSIPEAIRVKDMIQPLVKPDAIRDFIGTMDSIAQAHFQARWHGKKKVEVHPLVKEFALTIVCKSFLLTDDMDFIASLAGPIGTLIDGLMGIPINLPWTRYGRGIKASKLITTWIKERVVKRRQEFLSGVENQDVISHLMLIRDENGKSMGEDEIADKLLEFIIAGQDTVASVMTNAMKYLGENPQIYDKVYQEQREVASNKAAGEFLNGHDILKMKYLWNVIQETMRMYPPVSGIFKEAIIDFTYHGYRVPKGWKILLSVHATHRDPQYFSHPEKFDPSRFEDGAPLPYTYFPFGGGSKVCPGRSLAQPMMLVFLHNAIYRFKWKAIFSDEKVMPCPYPMPEKGLPVHLYPH